MPTDLLPHLEPQVWIPTVFPLDAPVFRALTSLVDDGTRPWFTEDGSAHSSAKGWPQLLTMSDAEAEAFLETLSPALTALFLAGYRVTHIDLGFRSLPDAVAENPTFSHPLNGHWLRFDLVARQVERVVRAVGANRNQVRLGVRPIHGRDGRSLAIPLDVARWDALVTGPEANDGGPALREGAMQAYMDRVFTRYPMIVGDEGETIAAYRRRLMAPLFEMAPAGGDLTFDLDFGFMTDRFGDAPPGANFRDAEKAVKDQVLMTVRLTLFDTLCWFAGKALMAAADAVNARNCGGTSDPDPPDPPDPTPAPEEPDPPPMADDEGLYAERSGPVPGEAYPGMLWILDPGHWQIMATEAALERHVEPAFGVIEGYCLQYADVLNSCGSYAFSDLVAPQPEDLAAGAARNVSRPSEDFLPVKATGMLDAKFYAPDDSTHWPETGCSGQWQTAIARFLDVQLGSSTHAERALIQRVKRRQVRAYRAEEDTRAYCNPTLQGMLGDTVLAYSENADELVRVAHLRSDMRAFDRMVADLARAAEGRGKESMAPAPGTPLVQKLLTTNLSRQIGRARYTDVLLAMINYGYFSIADTVGDLAEAQTPRLVLAEQETDQTIRLVHSLDPAHPIRLSALHIEEGLTLRDCVAWDFIAKPDPPDDLEALTALAAFDPVLAADLANPVERLVIVAAPGVLIEGREAFLMSCKVEIIRVQSAALVPEPGDPINPAALLAPRALSVLSGMEAFAPPKPSAQGEMPGMDAIVAASREKPQSLPLIHVAAVQDNDRSGVVLTAPGMPPLPKLNVPPEGQPAFAFHPFRGSLGQATVTITVPDDGPWSAQARFAFGFRYRLRWEYRDDGGRQALVSTSGVPAPPGANPDTNNFFIWGRTGRLVEVADFELIIFKTPAVQVAVSDSAYSTALAMIENADNWMEYLFGQDPFADLFTLDGGRRVYNGRPMTWTYHVYDMPIEMIPEQGTPLVPPDLNAPEWAGVTVNEAWLEKINEKALTSAAQMTFDLAVGMIPLIGEAGDAMDILLYLTLGRDRWGNKMTRGQFYMTVGGALLPFVSSRALRAMRSSGEAAGVVTQADDWLTPAMYPGAGP